MNIDKALVATRKLTLEQAAKQLKTEFYGLDTIIDKVISSVYAWFVFPELIKRPVIVNLWGMTGVGKTQLVRRLSSLLGYSNKFVEIQMDSSSGGSQYKKDTICSILSNCINEGEAGILLLDEIQRFRTVNDVGEDVRVERFQDVWMLLSDGKFAANSDLFLDLELTIAHHLYDRESERIREEEAAEEAAKPKDSKEGKGNTEAATAVKKKLKPRQFKLYPYEAKMLKQLLRLKEPIQEIMVWDAQRIESLLLEVRDSRLDWQVDYSKLLIFVSGNLDSAFEGSGNTEDCDTDADFYHEITSQITTVAIKHSLKTRFKPEQISRLGSNHVIYPSMKKSAYQQLIKATCKKYVDEMQEATEIRFSVEPITYEIIYANAVYPTQGTRPVFSAIHKIFSTGLVNVACWCLEKGIHDVTLHIDEVKQLMIAVDSFTGKVFNTEIDLEISTRRAKISIDMRTLVATHEAGHAVVYALLTKSAPIETKINAISFSKGYILPNEGLDTNNVSTKRTLRNRIAIALGGTVAEEIVFGADNRSTGCSRDLSNATLDAGTYVRRFGFDGTLSYINTLTSNDPVWWNTNLDETNAIIENILQDEKKRAHTLITENLDFYRVVVERLLQDKKISQNDFIELAKPFLELGCEARNTAFNDQYKIFAHLQSKTSDNRKGVAD